MIGAHREIDEMRTCIGNYGGRQSFGFFTKDEICILRENHVKHRAFSKFFKEKNMLRLWTTHRQKIMPRFVLAQCDVFPVVQTCTPHRFFRYVKTIWLDQNKLHIQCNTGPADGACVPGNLRRDQNDLGAIFQIMIDRNGAAISTATPALFATMHGRL